MEETGYRNYLIKIFQDDKTKMWGYKIYYNPTGRLKRKSHPWFTKYEAVSRARILINEWTHEDTQEALYGWPHYF